MSVLLSVVAAVLVAAAMVIAVRRRSGREPLTHQERVDRRREHRDSFDESAAERNQTSGEDFFGSGSGQSQNHQF